MLIDFRGATPHIDGHAVSLTGIKETIMFDGGRRLHDACPVFLDSEKGYYELAGDFMPGTMEYRRHKASGRLLVIWRPHAPKRLEE